jgi:hypothetical protein
LMFLNIDVFKSWCLLIVAGSDSGSRKALQLEKARLVNE